MATPLFPNTQETYSDLLPDFDIHPVKKDLVRLIDEAAVKRAIRNLLYTPKGSRPFNVNLGSGIRQYLFEPMSPITAQGLKSDITLTLRNHEPRINLQDVIVQPDYDGNAYNVSIVFNILNRSDPIVVAVTLERIR